MAAALANEDCFRWFLQSLLSVLCVSVTSVLKLRTKEFTTETQRTTEVAQRVLISTMPSHSPSVVPAQPRPKSKDQLGKDSPHARGFRDSIDRQNVCARPHVSLIALSGVVH